MTDATKRPNDDTELIIVGAALVRPYVESLGELSDEMPADEAPADEAPPGGVSQTSQALSPAVSAVDSPTVLLTVVQPSSASTRSDVDVAARIERSAVALRSHRALAMTRYPAGRSSRRRHRPALAVVAALAAVLAIGGGAAWLTRGGSAPRMPVAAAMPRIDMPSASASMTSPATHDASHGVKTSRPVSTPSPSASSPSAPSPSASSPSKDASAEPSVTPKLTPSNLAAGRPISDTGHAIGHAGADAVDGDLGTYWQGSVLGFPQSIMIDLGVVTTIGRIVLRLPPSWRARTESLAIECSADGHKFKTAEGRASYAFDPAKGNQATITPPARSCRFIRLKFSANTAWPAGQVSEIEVYSS